MFRYACRVLMVIAYSHGARRYADGYVQLDSLQTVTRASSKLEMMTLKCRDGWGSSADYTRHIDSLTATRRATLALALETCTWSAVHLSTILHNTIHVVNKSTTRKNDGCASRLIEQLPMQ